MQGDKHNSRIKSKAQYAGTWLNIPLAALSSLVLSPVWLLNIMYALITRRSIMTQQNKVDAFGRSITIRRFACGWLLSTGVVLDVLLGRVSFVGVPYTHRVNFFSQQRLEQKFSAPSGVFCDFDIQRTIGIKGVEKHLVLEQQLAASSSHFFMTFLKGVFVSAFFISKEQEQTPKVAELFGLPLNNLKMEEAVNWVVPEQYQLDQSANEKVAFFVNAHSVNLSSKSKSFFQSLLQASHLFADGSGMRLAAISKNIRLQANLNGTDMLPELCEQAQANNKSVFLLGGKQGIAEKTAANLVKKYPKLTIAGTEHGYFDHNNQAQNNQLIEKINQSGANILLVGFGSPMQESWCLQYADKLNCQRILAVGGLFDYFSGAIARAPQWMRETGLEWVWRLIQEPMTKFSRYVIGTPEFLFRLFFYNLSK